MRNGLKTLLFLSAFSPALLTLAYVRHDVYGLDQVVLQLVLVGILGTAIAFLIARLTGRDGEAFSFEAKKVESNDAMLLAFVASYLAPLAMRAVDLKFSMVVFLTAIAILILWLMSAIPAHPVLRVFGYRFYKVESSAGVVYTLISKRDIHDAKSVRLVKKISESMLMERNP